MGDRGIIIFTNHVAPWHIGGSEIVVDKIAENLSNYVPVVVCGGDVPSFYNYKNYNQHRVSDISDLNAIFSKYKNYEIFIYSDGYFFTKFILDYCKLKNKKVYLAPVGFNITREKEELKKRILSYDNIKYIYHDTNYIDFAWGNENLSGITGHSYCVIPNGFDDFEFKSVEKKHFNKKSIITIANTFPFKGHDLCINVLDTLVEEFDFEYHVFCTTPSWLVAKNKMKWLISEGEKRSKWMHVHVDSKREKMISYLKGSSLMLFLSQKEVSPLVLVESCAAAVPWLSFNVGNSKSIPSGMIFDAEEDYRGNKIMDESLKLKILNFIKNGIFNDSFIVNKDVSDNFLSERSWSHISKMYYNFIFK
jgi:glycosyltransferase involved in cell wall biosynthesis